MQNRLLLIALLVVVVLCLAAGLAYSLPAVREPVQWQFNRLRLEVFRFFNPPEEVVFIPQEGDNLPGVETIVAGTLSALLSPTPAETNQSTPIATLHISQTALPTATQAPSPTPTLTSTPIPEKVVLEGIRHEYQQFNNCAPANLAMALSFWGWQGNQNDTRAFLRPNREVDDKNVNPAEMVAYVQEFTPFRALARYGGDLLTLKKFIAAGIPVIIEKGHDPPDDWWMGHYLVLNGYDDTKGVFITQDSLIQPNLPLPYEEIERHEWRDFNYVYILIYPPEMAAQAEAIVGAHLDETYNLEHSAQKALQEITQVQGRDLLFAWFNLGASMTALEDYATAADAFDHAFAIYQNLPEEERPYRLMWYRTEPYAAYYHTTRYQDLIQLANATFTWVGQPVLEESYYWRGMAYLALGNKNQAIADLKKAAALNPNYLPPRQALADLGVSIP